MRQQKKRVAMATAKATETATATETTIETAGNVGGGGGDTAIMVTGTTQACWIIVAGGE